MPIESGLKLPRLILVADRFTDSSVSERALQAVEAGVSWIHLRDHDASEMRFLYSSKALVDAMRGLVPDVLISVNGRPDVAARLGLNFHYGRYGVHPNEAWANDKKVGYSAHSLNNHKLLASHKIDYFFFSPIFPVLSKPSKTAIGIDPLRKFCRSIPATPVYALGGIKSENVGQCLDAGAYGVAVVSGILEAIDVKASVQNYLRVLGG